MTRSDYEDAFKRRDKRTLQQLLAEEEAIIDDEAADFETAEKEAIAAASSTWVPLTPQYIDAHFQLWSLSRRSGDIYEGVTLPGDLPWGEKTATQRLQRDFNPDMYEEDLFEMKCRANAELKEGIGELSPIQYAIHVHVRRPSINRYNVYLLVLTKSLSVSRASSPLPRTKRTL